MLISQEDLRHFVGSKADYYVQQWSKLEQTGKKLSLNKGVFIVLIVGMAIMYLAAGILADYQLSTLLQIVFGVILSLMPLLWFFYRKLYVTMIVVWLCFFGFDLLLYSAVYFIAKIFMSKVELLALVKNNVGWSAGIYVLVSLGKIVYLSSLASFLLYRKATKVITVIKNKEHDSVLQNRMIEGKGGTVTDKLQLLPKSVRQTFLPISMALMAFILSLLIGELKYAETLELLATDNLKFSSKKHINPMSNKKADSDIFIMGITEESEATLVQSLFGPYPYPRETYGDFLSYFHLDIPERLKANFIAASVEFASSQKSAKITQLVNMIYKFENDKYVMREKIKNNPKLREEHANLWFYNVYDMNLEEVKRLTWNSIAPRLVFFDIFFDFPRSKQSDQLFFDELKRQQQYNNIFMDYMTEKTKTGRLSGDTSVQLSERMKYATLWEIKNVKDQFGKKRLADIKDQAIGFDIKPPLLGIVENIPGIGPANILKSFDGKRRRMSLIWTIYDERIMERPIFIPTIDLAIYIHLIYDIKSAEQLQKVMAEKVHFQFGRSVTLKDVTIKKRINYVRQSLTDPDKKYRWMEYIDPFMNRILTKLIEKLKDSNTLSYKRFLSEMLNDKELKKLLISKYQRNKLDVQIDEKIMKREITDFLMSMTETSFTGSPDTLMLEESKLKDIKLNVISKYLNTLTKEHNVLKHFIYQGDVSAGPSSKVTFLDDKNAKVAYKNAQLPQNDFFQFITNESDAKKKDITDMLNFLNKKKLIKYKVIAQQRFDLKILNKRLFTLLEKSEKNKKVKDVINYIGNWPVEKGSLSNELFTELKKQVYVSRDFSKKVIAKLVKSKAIYFNEKVSETIFIEVPDIDNLIKFRDEDPNLNLIKRKIIYSIINKLEIMIKGESDAGKFYILPADNVLSYISTATGYSKKELKDIFDSININPRGESSIASVRIEIDKGDLKFKMPELISKYVRDSRINILIIKELINYLKGKSSSEIYYNKMLTAMTKNLIDNDKIKDLSPLTLSKRLKEISNSISEKTLSDPYELTQIPDENKTITANAANLSKYLNFKKDIEIPVDDKGQLIINFQGYSRSYQNASFGKYLGITRHLPHPATGKTVPFDWFKFKNRSILIGFYTSTGLGKGRDYFETPYDTLYGIEIHANALYTLFERDFIHTLKPIKITENLSFSIDFLVMLAFALIFGFVVPKINILRGFLFSALMALLFIIINVYYVFGKLQIDFPILGTFFSMGFTFLFLTVFKLMTEEKEKKQIKSMFSKYVSPDLVNELTSTSKKLELGGEDRILTVLFSDIRGFTTLSEGLEPQELVNHLNIYLSVMTEIVYKYKGTLDKYIGDAIMAFWGAPIEIPDHALLSCKAALEMMDELDKLNLEWPPAKHIRIGIGLNTGKMTVGNMGSANRMDYTIMGDSVNLGSRVEAVNKTYTTEVIITEFTYDLVKDHVIVRELDMIQVKGKTEPVKIYELLAVND